MSTETTQTLEAPEQEYNTHIVVTNAIMEFATQYAPYLTSDRALDVRTYILTRGYADNELLSYASIQAYIGKQGKQSE